MMKIMSVTEVNLKIVLTQNTFFLTLFLFLIFCLANDI